MDDKLVTESDRNDIETREDIVVFVDSFYEKVKKDSLLAPIFNSKIESDHWQEHLNRMYDFWYAMIFYSDRYEGNPLAKHISLPVGEAHFQRWLKLFGETIDEHFEGATADGVKERADRIASVFLRKIEQFQDWKASQA